MKQFRLLFLSLLLLSSTYAQDKTKNENKDSISYKKLDSLILAKTNVYLESTGALSSGKTRGINEDPCEEDMQNLKKAFGSLKEAYIKCCRQQSSNVPVLKSLAYIYLVLNNSNCVWDDHPIMYAALLYYWADYASLVKKLNCTSCGGN